MEIEAKLGVPDGVVMRRLARVRTLAGFDLRPSGASHVCDTYVDTRQRLLRSAGLVCRRRVTAGGLQYTVKALERASGAVHRREELEVRLSADAPPARWPRSRARRRVLGIVGEEPLEPIAELEQWRRKRTVLAGRRIVAEMSLDFVRVAVRGGEHTFHEFEIELRRAGKERDLTAMVAALKQRWGLVDVSESKLTRALAIVDGMDPLGPGARRIHRNGPRQHGSGETTRRRKPSIRAPAEAEHTSARRERPPRRGAAGAPTAVAPAEQARPKQPRLKRPGMHPTTTMAEAARRTLAVHFGRMLDHEPGTRLGEDPEELHDMRVATRRMRAAQRLFAPHLERKVMKPFRKGLRRTGRMLGALRDLDVFHEKTLRYLVGLPEDRRGELGPLLELLGRTREAAREELLAYLDGEEYRVFCESFAEFLSAPGAGAAPVVGRDGEHLPHEVRHVVPAELYRHHGEVLAFDAPLAAPEPPLHCYHLLRITAKGLRYTLEFFAEVLDEDAKVLIRDVKALQDHLGNLQDAVVACTLLSDFLRRGHWGKDRRGNTAAPIQVAPGVAAYLAARQTELQSLLDGFPPVWTRVRDREFGARLGTLAAALAVSGPRDPVS